MMELSVASASDSSFRIQHSSFEDQYGTQQSQTEKGIAPREEARRALAGIRPRQDVEPRREGAEVALRFLTHARIRRRTDAAASPPAEARIHEHLQERARRRECE